MLSGILDRLERFFGASFIVSAVFPVVVFFSILSGLAVALFGFNSTAELIRDLYHTTGPTLIAIAAAPVMILAFILRTLRAPIIAVWSGDGFIWTYTSLGAFMRRRQLRKRDELERVDNGTPSPSALNTELRATLLPVWTTNRPAATQSDIHDILTTLVALASRTPAPSLESEAFSFALDQCIDLHKNFEAPSLAEVRNKLRTIFVNAEGEKPELDGKINGLVKPFTNKKAGPPVGGDSAVLDGLLADLDSLVVQLREPPFQISRGAFKDIVERSKTLYEEYDSPCLDKLWNKLDWVSRKADAEFNISAQTKRYNLATQYGSPGTEKATALGNTIEALNTYPFVRYKIEGSVFWPYLIQASKGDIREQIGQQQMLLDTGLNLATIFLLTGLAFLLLGPWIAWRLELWIPTAIALGLASMLLYNVSLNAARALGTTLRAACDLYRLDVLYDLYRPHPATLEEEQKIWQDQFALAVYGAIRNPEKFLLRPRESTDSDTATSDATAPPPPAASESTPARA